MVQSYDLFAKITTPLSTSHNFISATWELIQGRLWPLIEEALYIKDHHYRPLGSFEVLWLGKLLFQQAINKIMRFSSPYATTKCKGRLWAS